MEMLEPQKPMSTKGLIADLVGHCLTDKSSVRLCNIFGHFHHGPFLLEDRCVWDFLLGARPVMGQLSNFESPLPSPQSPLCSRHHDMSFNGWHLRARTLCLQISFNPVPKYWCRGSVHGALAPSDTHTPAVRVLTNGIEVTPVRPKSS